MDSIKLDYRSSHKQFSIAMFTNQGTYRAFFDTYTAALFYIQKMQPCRVYLDASLTDKGVYSVIASELDDLNIWFVRD